MEGLLIAVAVVGGLIIIAKWSTGDPRDTDLLAPSRQILSGGARLLGRGAVAGARYGIPALMNQRRRVSDPEKVELVERERSIPNRTPGLEDLQHGLHWTPAGLIEDVHMGSIALSGGAKGQTIANYQIQFQLQYSPENLLILEVKPNQELSKVAAAYARPGDRFFVYTLHPHNKKSSGLYVPQGRELEDFAHSLTYEPDSKDPHWNTKAAQLIPATGEALAAEGKAATLGNIAASIMDRQTLEQLIEDHRVVDNVADNEKEWGYIRSNATRHLTALNDERVARMFAGTAKTPQPFDGRGQGRDIIVVRPHEPSAEREARYIVAILDILLNRAGQDGYAGGRGTYAVLDEFASFLNLSKMRRYLDIGRGGKLQMSYFLQGRSQLAAQVGQTEANSILDNTEILAVGPTNDHDLARSISDLAGHTRVDYQSARQTGEILRNWQEESVPVIRPTEITNQGEANWTIKHVGDVSKTYVAKEDYHHTQAAPPQKLKISGIPKQPDRS